MPIYTVENSPETPDMFHYSPMSVIVHLGAGDVLISTAYRSVDSNEVANEILFTPSEPHPIGEYTEEHKGKPTHAPVVLRFDQKKSIDSLIYQLEKLKDGFVTDTHAALAAAEKELETESDER